MKRTIVVGGILLVLVIVFLILVLPRISSEGADPFDAVPADASLIVELPHAKSNQDQFENDTLWSLLKGYALPQRLSAHLHLIQSVLAPDSGDPPLLETELLASIHSIAADDFGLLYILRLPAGATKKKLEEILPKAETHTFSGSKIYEADIEGGGHWAFAMREGLLMASHHPYLVESAVDRLSGRADEPASMQNLEQVRQQASKNDDAKLYFNFSRLPQLLALFLGDDYNHLGNATGHFATWAEMDIRSLSQGLLMNGYLTTDGDSYLSRISESPELKANLAEVLPFNTAVFYQINTRNLEHLVKPYGAEALERFNESFMNWAGNLVGLAVVEPFGADYNKDCFVVVEAADTAIARQQLTRLASEQQNVVEASAEPYKGFSIYHLADLDDLESTVGLGSSIMKDPYFVIVDRYVVFGNSIANIKVLLERYVDQQTLDKDLDYLTFKQQLTNNPAFYLFVNTARCVQLLSGLGNETFAEYLGESADQFHALNPIGIQLTSYKDHMYMVNGLAQTFGEFQVTTDLLWKTELDTAVARGPWLVINHDDNSKELFVQDAHNYVYLIDGSGEILWHRQLDGPIVGDVQQVDYYRNGKLQYIFATKGSIHLIDRLGRFVENFPLRLSSEVTSGLSVFDYNRNGEFRMFLGCANGNVYGFYKSGQPLPGWSPKRGLGRIELPLDHFVSDTRDYMMATNTEGTTYLLNRQAENRLGPYRIKANFPQPFTMEQLGPRDFRLVNTDTTGMVYYLNKNETIDHDSLFESHGAVRFVYADLNGDDQPEYVFQDATRIQAFDFERQEVFNVPLINTVSGRIFLVDGMPGYHRNIGFATSGEQIYLLAPDGSTVSDFPLDGTTRFVIGSLLNPGEQMVVTGLSDGTLTAYRLK